MTELPAEKPYVKPGKVEITMRVSKILELLIAGATRAQVIQYASENTKWAVGERQIDNYIRKANKVLEGEANYHRQRELGRAVRRYNHLYAKSMAIQDYKAALAVQKALDELLGLKAADPTKPGPQKLILEWASGSPAPAATAEPS